MNNGWESFSCTLSVRLERPIAECETIVYPFLNVKSATLDNQGRSKFMEANPHSFTYGWYRGPKRPICCNNRCPRGSSFDPTKWSRASCGGPSILCAVCERAKVSRYESVFCSIGCFKEAWKTHSEEKHTNLKFSQSIVDGDTDKTRQDLEKLDVVVDKVTEISSVSTPGGNVINMSTTSNTTIFPSCGVSIEENDECDWVKISSDRNYVPTLEDVGCVLKVEVCALSSLGKVLAGPILTYSDPVLASPKGPPKRALVTMPGGLQGITPVARFRVVSYNILAEMYATKQAYPYCDSWSLNWPFRKKILLQELDDAQGDIICLQEVQSDHYDQHLNPYMQHLGYDGIYKAKSRDSMGPGVKVDGCATFWRKSKFIMTDQFCIEFNDCARRVVTSLGLEDVECRKYFNRLNKDNIAQAVVLEALTPRSSAPTRMRQLICVVNTHLYSNHQRSDVKLWQTLTLISEIEQYIVSRDIPLLLCGDFNSEPSSAVYEFLSDGAINQHHPEVEESDNLHILPDLHNIGHSLNLNSVMKGVLGSEPTFSNFTALFRGTLDYIWHSPRLRVLAVHGVPDEKDLCRDGEEGLPSCNYPSDHIMLCCDMALTSSGGITRNMSASNSMTSSIPSRGSMSSLSGTMGNMMGNNSSSNGNAGLMRSKSTSNVPGNNPSNPTRGQMGR